MNACSVDSIRNQSPNSTDGISFIPANILGYYTFDTISATSLALGECISIIKIFV